MKLVALLAGCAALTLSACSGGPGGATADNGTQAATNEPDAPPAATQLDKSSGTDACAPVAGLYDVTTTPRASGCGQATTEVAYMDNVHLFGAEACSSRNWVDCSELCVLDKSMQTDGYAGMAQLTIVSSNRLTGVTAVSGANGHDCTYDVVATPQ